MTVPASLGHVEYLASGAGTVYTFDWAIDSGDELEVRYDNAIQTQDDTYTLTINGSLGGSITTSTTLAANTVVALRRIEALEQLLSLTRNAALPASALESRLDKMVKQSQMLNEELSRRPALVVGSAEAHRDLVLPVEAGMVLAWNSDATGLTLLDPTTSTTPVADLALIDDASGSNTAFRFTADPGEIGTENKPTNARGEVHELRYAIYDTKKSLDPTITYWYETPAQPLRWANVKYYGATGDGTTDDYTAVAAALATLSSGGVLYFPPGTYAMSHGLCVTTNGITILGAGKTVSKLKAISGITSTAGLLALGYNSSYVAVGCTDIVVQDIGVDGNDLCWCIKGSTLTRCMLYRVRSENSLRALAQFYSSTDVCVQSCHLEDSNAADQFGDALYFGGCTRPKALYNYIYDYKRIGITTEADGGTKSSDALIVGNTISYGHDNTVAEANAGIWVENTKSAVIRDNKISNQYNSPGTEKPRGIVVGPGHAQTNAFFLVQGNQIEDVWYGIAVNPNDATSTVIVQGNVVRVGTVFTQYVYGVHIGSGHQIYIKDNEFGTVTFDGVSYPGSTILVDTVSNIDTIHIENNQVDGITHYATSGDYRTYSMNSHTCTNLRFRNQNGKIQMGAVGYTNVIATGCVFTGDSTVSRPFSATGRLQMSDCTFTTTGGTAMITAYSDAQFLFNNCHFPTLKFAYQTTSTGPSWIKFNHCYFGSGSYVEFDGVTNLFFDSCLMHEYRTFASGGFLKGNATNHAAHIRIRNCDFFHSSAEVPIKAGSFQPTSLMTVGCTTDAAALGAGLIRGAGAMIAENSFGVDVVATANLPAAGADQNGRLIIEDAGAGDRNIILYGGGQRFRIDGGAAV